MTITNLTGLVVMAIGPIILACLAFGMILAERRPRRASRIRNLWRRLSLQFARDDLFLRVSLLCLGAPIFALGAWAIYGSATGAASNSAALTAFLALLGVCLSSWGLLLMSRCVVPANSRLAKLAEQAFDGGVAPEALIVFIPLLLIVAFITIGHD